jgi:CHAT domain-containing protein
LQAIRELSRLPDTREELFAIAKALGVPPSSVSVGKQATEARIKQTPLSNTRVLAFATHGLIGGDFSGLVEPALVLTPPERATFLDDGPLTASEFAQLKLNADWAILSACNTASNDGTPGAAGLSGLARAFIFAGSRSLLVSHWPVDSRAAALLTTRMLQEIRQHPGIRKDEALRRAMLGLMANRAYSHPIFWAPFVIVGA